MKTRSFFYATIACFLTFFVILSLSSKFAPDVAAYNFINPLNLYLNPPSPIQSLIYGDKIHVGFYYCADEAVRIFVRPFTNGAKTPGCKALGSPILPATNGVQLNTCNGMQSNTWFTILDKYNYDYVCIDSLRFQMFSASTRKLLLEFSVYVDYCYTYPEAYSDGYVCGGYCSGTGNFGGD